MKKIKAVYAASLDPITNGHINIIERMSPLYDELVILVAIDERKSYTFNIEERVAMAKSAVKHIQNVSVDVCTGQYVIRKAKSIGAKVIIRGIRSVKDLENEQTLAEVNREICKKIETIWVPCTPSLMHVSSSMVKAHVGVDPDWEKQLTIYVPTMVIKKLKEKFILQKAKKYWAKLMLKLNNPAGSEVLFEELIQAYSQPHRFYHTLEHIINMLDELESINLRDSAVSLAIWFHDSVYDTKANDNEEQSANWAKNSIKKLGLSDPLAEEVYNLIMDTTHKSVPNNPKSKILVDVDIAIFGKPDKDFNNYESGIRKEYEWVPEHEFIHGRSRIIQLFLDRDSIYSTDLFKDKYESRARGNLKNQLIKFQQQSL